MAFIECAECRCTPQDCSKTALGGEQCTICKKEICCCSALHKHTSVRKSLRLIEQSASVDKCCSAGSCKDEIANQMPSLQEKKTTGSWLYFFRHAKSLYAAALGIEILCIAAAEIGENVGLYMFGFNIVGIPIAYAMGYALAGFTTFATILGRYNYGSGRIDSCCSILEQGGAAGSGFVSNLKLTFTNFAAGIVKIPQLHRQRNVKYILKTSAYILVTAESACILTAETVGIIFYQHSILLAVPLALLVGAFTVVAPEAYRKAKRAKATQ